jgi:hypothetical protein
MTDEEEEAEEELQTDQASLSRQSSYYLYLHLLL